MSYVPFLAGKDHLVAGNARLEAIDYTAFTAGPAVGGLLVQLVAAPAALAAGRQLPDIGAAAWPGPGPGARAGRGRRRADAHGDLGGRDLRGAQSGAACRDGYRRPADAVRDRVDLRPAGLPGSRSSALAGSVRSCWPSGGRRAGGRAECDEDNREGLGAPRVMRLTLAVTTPFILIMPLAHAGWQIAFYAAGAFVSWFGSAVFNVAHEPAPGPVPSAAARPDERDDELRQWGTMPHGGHRRGARPGARGPAGAVGFRCVLCRRRPAGANPVLARGPGQRSLGRREGQWMPCGGHGSIALSAPVARPPRAGGEVRRLQPPGRLR